MYPQKVPAVVPGTVHWFWSEIANFLVPGLTLRKILLVAQNLVGRVAKI